VEIRLINDPPTARSAGVRPLVISGASRGIGRATALLAARRGQRLCLVGRPSEAMHRCVNECRGLGGDVAFVPCDLAQPFEIERAAQHILAVGPPLALVNNAAIVERAGLHEITLESYQRQMDTNLLAPIWLTRALLKAMHEAGGGRVVNVGSISGTLGSAGQSVYNASKWALVGFTKSLAEELTGSQVSVVIVLPGGVATDMMQGSPYQPRMSADDVAQSLLHYALEAPLAHNGASIEMFGV
jgi:3-oxoacyl-[acyl-carrier protein] reductase